jgi:hypothetical protein
MSALAAFVDMAAQSCRTAGCDGIQGPFLLARQGMLTRKIGASKNVGQFKSWPRHGEGSVFGFALSFLAETRVEIVERALGLADQERRDVGIARSGVDTAMAKQRLNDTDVGAAFQQVSSEAVT